MGRFKDLATAVQIMKDRKQEQPGTIRPSPANVVYLAGPLTTHGDAQANRDTAVRYARDLARQGYTLIVPHFFLELDDVSLSYEYWMGACLSLLDRADEAMFIPGWEQSRGACIEHDYCIDTGIPVSYLEALEEDELHEEGL